MSDALTLDAISKTYDKGKENALTVLDTATLTLAKGEVVALVAPSGAGKSTLLHIAGLLDNADTGRVLISGIDMTDLSDAARTAARREDVGFVYQFHHLLPEFSAVENIKLPQLANAVPEREAHDNAMALMARIGVDRRADNRPAALSGGEQQRVAFCRALANKPKILLADEPTGNLDPATSDTVFSVLMDLVRETGLSALIATHNPELAARMDRIMHLENGRLI